MSRPADLRPPRWLMALFHWFCHPDYREEIEGDLLEQFCMNAKKHGTGQAKWLFAGEVLRLLRPEIIVNFHFFTTNTIAMKTKNWLNLVALNLLFALSIIMPYLPGPPNKLVLGLSALGQFMGFFGIALLPIGFVWAIVEYQKRSGKTTNLNNWNSGYYFAIAATVVCALIYLLMAAVLYSVEGWWTVGVAAPLGLLALWKVVPGIRRLRQQSLPSFSPAPLYLLSIPIIALLAKLLLMEPIADYGRNLAIQQSEPLLTAIEDFNAKEGRYPESLNDLQPAYLADIPQPSVMGINTFNYEKTPDAYKLSFWQHLGATEELVVYNKNNHHDVKGHYASYEAEQQNWRYYWLD